MYILSIDVAAAKPTAYALFLNDKLSCFDKAPGVDDIEDVVAMITDLDMILAEDMYLGKNVETLKKLCYEAGAVMHIARTYQIECKLIRPVDWQRHHGLLKKNDEYTKILRRQIIKQTCMVDIEDEDIQAAVLIGLCEIEKRRYDI